MNPDETRIRILELIGWKGPFCKEWLREYGCEGEDVWQFCGTSPEGVRAPAPDFNSLDACAEFEAEINKCEITAKEYAAMLRHICCGNDFMFCTATPAQRCAAFLSIKGVTT